MLIQQFLSPFPTPLLGMLSAATVQFYPTNVTPSTHMTAAMEE